jgi:dTDP-4-dehydrorhamnose 3,5-epimerase-like enzyme
MTERPIPVLDPPAVRLAGVAVARRVVHYDHRGYLLETLRADDQELEGPVFSMSYSVVTLPGKMRDQDRWHVHRRQTDRFACVLGECLLALLDRRPNSSTAGQLVVVRLTGGSLDTPPTTEGRLEGITYLATVPPQVYHSVMNPSDRTISVVQNFPTRLYDRDDEGRVAFSEAPLEPPLGGTFTWGRVEKGPR